MGQLVTLKHLGVDEKAVAKRHRYATLLNDLDRGVVLEVAEGRTKESLETCFASVPQEQLTDVEAFAMDMWQPYFRTVLGTIEDGARKITRFHLMIFNVIPGERVPELDDFLPMIDDRRCQLDRTGAMEDRMTRNPIAEAIRTAGVA